MVQLQDVNDLFKQFEKTLDDAKNMGEAYIMVFKPYNRKIIINPRVFKENNNIYVTNNDCSIVLNTFNFDEISIGVTDEEFYNKYDFNNIIVK